MNPTKKAEQPMLLHIALIFTWVLATLTFFFAVNTRAILINELSDLRQLESKINKVISFEETK
jgi:hypothetical protein